jgi:tetratricopeptide (TPR) repeat protein
VTASASQDRILSDLKREIAWVGTHSGLHCALDKDGGDLENLRRIAEYLESSLFRTNPTIALIRIFDTARERLKEKPIGKAVLVSPLEFSEAAEVLYSYSPDIPISEAPSYKARYRVLKESTHSEGRPNKNLERGVAKLRGIIAEELRDMEREKKDRSDWEDEDPSFISRPGRETEIEQATRSDKHITLLHGDAGTGKSTLAYHTVRAFLHIASTDPFPVVSAHTDESLQRSLMNVLEQHHVPIERTDLPSLQRSFKAWLAQDSAAPILLIDNVERQELFEALVPQKPYGRVVVTSRRILKGGNVRTVEIPNMETDEARAMVSLDMPDNSDEDVERLAKALDCRPLAIVHGCACLKGAPYKGDVDQFCEALNRNIAVVLDSYGDEGEATLTAIYRMVLDQLQPYPNALLVLDLITLLGPFLSIKEMLPLLWPYSSPPANNAVWNNGKTLPPEDQQALDKGIRILQQRNLLQTEQDDTSAMHTLTAEIISFLRQAKALEIAEQAFWNIGYRLKVSDWPGGRPVPTEWPHITLTVAKILAILRKSDSSLCDNPRLAHLWAVAIRQLRNIGPLHSAHLDIAMQLIKKSWESVDLAPKLCYEMLELETALEYDDSLLPWIRRIMGDVYSYEMTFRDDVDQATAMFDFFRLQTLAPELVAYYEREGDLPAAARHCYAFGVVCFQLSKWNEARSWYSRSVELYSRVGQEMAPEFMLYAAESLRRLVELAQRTLDHESIIELVPQMTKIWQDHEASFKQTDQILRNRWLHTGTRSTFHFPLIDGSNPHDIMEGSVFRVHRRVWQMTVEAYQNLGLSYLGMKALYDVIRVDAAFGAEQARDGFKMLARVYQGRHSGLGAALCNLATLKSRLTFNDTPTYQELLEISRRAERLGRKILHRYHSPFWRADALNVSYATLLMAGASGARAERIRADANKALAAVGREDKFEIAERVGSGNLHPRALLAE